MHFSITKLYILSVPHKSVALLSFVNRGSAKLQSVCVLGTYEDGGHVGTSATQKKPIGAGPGGQHMSRPPRVSKEGSVLGVESSSEMSLGPTAMGPRGGELAVGSTHTGL